MMEVNDTILFIIDVQTKLVEMLKNGDEIVKNNFILAKSANMLGLPIIVSEQYPQGLGQTISDVGMFVNKENVYEKTSFSALFEEKIYDAIKSLNVKNVILTGIESHICVYQTAVSLLENGYNVYVVKNAVSSRKSKDYRTSLELMRDFGARLTCVESVLFELLKSSKNPKFKDIQSLIK